MGKITKEARRKMIVQKAKLGRELTEAEKRKIIKNVKRTNARKNAIRGIIVALGLGGLTAGGHALLTSGKGEETKENKEQIETSIDNIENQDPVKQFKNEYSINLEENINKVHEIGQNTLIRENVQNEIDELVSSEEVLDYIKGMYIEEYNKQNDTKYTIDDLKISKERFNQDLYLDTATNGDRIIRSGKQEDSYEVNAATGVISARIKDEDEILSQKVINYLGNYETIYSKNEEVQKYDDNFLVEMAPILSAGIDWSTAMHQEGTSYEVKEEYKHRLIEVVANYRMNQNEISQEVDER